MEVSGNIRCSDKLGEIRYLSEEDTKRLIIESTRSVWISDNGVIIRYNQCPPGMTTKEIGDLLVKAITKLQAKNKMCHGNVTILCFKNKKITRVTVGDYPPFSETYNVV